MNFDAFLKTAWADHGDRPQEVADRLAASIHVVETPEQVAPFARLLAHVFGEHLGEWERGIALLQSLRDTAACAGDAAALAVAQRMATLRYAKGDTAELLALPIEARICALAEAASMLSGRGAFGDAIAAYGEATRLAEPQPAAGSPANRALAIGGNNLAAALETKIDRTAVETEGMVAAADGGSSIGRSPARGSRKSAPSIALPERSCRPADPLRRWHARNVASRSARATAHRRSSGFSDTLFSQ